MRAVSGFVEHLKRSCWIFLCASSLLVSSVANGRHSGRGELIYENQSCTRNGWYPKRRRVARIPKPTRNWSDREWWRRVRARDVLWRGTLLLSIVRCGKRCCSVPSMPPLWKPITFKCLTRTFWSPSKNAFNSMPGGKWKSIPIRPTHRKFQRIKFSFNYLIT